MKNNTTTNATVNNANEFYAELGKLVVKYFGGDFAGFKMIVPPLEEKKKGVKETARNVSYQATRIYDGTETDAEILIRIVAKHPEIRLRDESETYVKRKTGVLTCENAAMWMINKSADNGKLFDEVIDVAIASYLHEDANGLCAPTLLMIWRVLALHNYNHAKVKELLIELLRKNTVNAITVLAKATEKYTQRNVHDQRVMYIEEKLAEIPGIKNQMK